MRELEHTYLPKKLPADLHNHPSKELVDIYLPADSRHPVLRLRKRGSRLVLTKKQPIGDDSSVQEEQTIVLSEEEYAALAQLPGKKIAKIRYSYPYNGRELEVDVFQEDLKGLVLVDAEFDNEEEKRTFAMPDFCFVDVTQEEFIAGGMLCGKSYADIQEQLATFGYRRLTDE